MSRNYLKSKPFSKILLTSILLSQFTFGAETTSLDEIRKKVIKEKHQSSSLLSKKAILNSRYVSWGVDTSNKTSSINLIDAWKKFEKKRDVVVAVIDTGIDPNHPFLKENLYTLSGSASKNNYGIDFSKGMKKASEPIDTHGHGTHVSGIIKSVFPNVKILSLKYYNKKASGKENLNSTIKALQYAVNQGVDIINYSGGGPEPDLEELRILKQAEQKGIIIIAAAGNEQSNIDIKKNAYFPASYGLSNIVTVTAHDKNLQILSSSNYGKKSVDITAPGFRIKSALPNRRAGFLTGTSQATAFVSGVAAMLKAQFPDLTAAQVKKILVESANKSFTFIGKCKSEGRLDAAKAIELASKVSQQNKNVRGYAKTAKATKKKEKMRNVANSNREGKIIYRLNKKAN